jgi:hypothetical protein
VLTGDPLKIEVTFNGSGRRVTIFRTFPDVPLLVGHKDLPEALHFMSEAWIFLNPEEKARLKVSFRKTFKERNELPESRERELMKLVEVIHVTRGSQYVTLVNNRNNVKMSLDDRVILRNWGIPLPRDDNFFSFA